MSCWLDDISCPLCGGVLSPWLSGGGANCHNMEPNCGAQLTGEQVAMMRTPNDESLGRIKVRPWPHFGKAKRSSRPGS